MSRSVRDALAISMQVGQPVLLWGGPGEGKSSLIEQVATQLGRPCEVVVGSVREAADFAGLPMRVGDGVSFVPPAWAVRCTQRPDTVVFLDELSTAQPSVQAAMLRVVLERQAGDLSLPESVSFVAAANPPEVSSGGDDLSAPLANRFCHLDWEADPAQWVSGILHGWAPPEIPVLPEKWTSFAIRWRALLGGFISARPSVLRMVPEDLVAQGRAWPSPRTWDVAHRLAAASEAAGADKEVRSLLVSGMVGSGPAIEFLRFADTADLPDPEGLLLDPSDLVVAGRVDLLLAQLASVTTAVAGDCSQQRWEAAWEVLAIACAQGRADVAAIAAVGLLELRQPGWPAPPAARSFAPVLRAAELV